MSNTLTWLSILFCITQSAMFSGLNLAYFSFTRLRLEIEAESSASKKTKRVLKMRTDSNYLLTTILWGNVGINVLLTLLSESVLTGVLSFLFSTIVITIFGEIFPQAYFSRNALRMAAFFSPILKFYQILLFPVAQPSALILDAWLGKEKPNFFSEKYIKLFIKKHIKKSDSEIDYIEGVGAINFLSLDDMRVSEEGEIIHPDSIISIRYRKDAYIFPEYDAVPSDPFIKRINRSEEKWIVFTSQENYPVLVLDSDSFLRSILFEDQNSDILHHCHIPLVINDNSTNLGEILKLLRNKIDKFSDVPIEKDIVLFWSTKQKKIITGADIFGRLLQGI